MDIENCPKCGAKLVKGTFFIEGPHIFSIKYLTFENEEESPKGELCFKSTDPNKRSKCSMCGLMIIDPPPKRSSEPPELPFIAGKGV